MQGRFALRPKASGRRVANRPYPGLAVVRGESPAHRLYIWVALVKITKVPVRDKNAELRSAPAAIGEDSCHLSGAKDLQCLDWIDGLRTTADPSLRSG